MATKQAVDMRAFERDIRGLAARFGVAKVEQKAERLALAIVSFARRAPVPRDTGALDASGYAKVVRPGVIRLGFGGTAVKYAAIQDLGGKTLPAKPYGSDVGPNKYFSETFRQRKEWFLQQLAADLQRDLKRAGRKGRRK